MLKAVTAVYAELSRVVQYNSASTSSYADGSHPVLERLAAAPCFLSTSGTFCTAQQIFLPDDEELASHFKDHSRVELLAGSKQEHVLAGSWLTFAQVRNLSSMCEGQEFYKYFKRH